MTDHAKIRSLLAERRPGHALQRPFYTDADIFAFDVEAIYARSWLMVGFECELPEAGSYLSLSVGNSPIILVRDDDDRIRGFHNSCRHRGAQLCEAGAGNSPTLVCPYHQWVYDLSGDLLHAGQMPESFRAAEHSLNPIHVEALAGTLYVCLARHAPDFAPFRAAFEPMLAPQNLRSAKVAHEVVLVEKANWKLVMENARECYHCAACHPELAFTFPVSTTRNGGYAEEADQERYAARMAAAGLAAGPVGGEWWEASRFPLNEGAVSMSMDGAPAVARPMVAAYGGDVGSLRWAIQPHAFCHALGDYVFFFSALPVGPQETHVVGKWLVRGDAVEGVDYTVEGLTETWNATNFQDRDLAENNQRGVNSLGFIPGPYSEEAESLVIRFVDWYCARANDAVDEAIGPRMPHRLLKSA